MKTIRIPRLLTVQRNALTVRLPKGFLIYNLDIEAYEEWDPIGRSWDNHGDADQSNLGEQVINIDDTWDASTGVFPTPNKGGYQYTVSTPGTVDGVLYNIGDMVIAKDDDASATDGNDWNSIRNAVATPRSLEFTATQGQVTFSMPTEFVPESVRFTYEGYTVAYGSRLTSSGNNVTLLNLGFDLDAGDVVTFTYAEA